MRRFALFFAHLAGPVVAEGWQSLHGDEIREALEGRKLQYQNAWQDFRSSGQQLYNAGRDSWGYWRIDRDRYCSQWPLQGSLSVRQDEAPRRRAAFVGGGDDITEGIYAD